MSKRVGDNSGDTSGSTVLNSKAPKDNTVIEEGTGIITSDSLAAESISAGGDFASGHATADSVPSKSSTASTTDTSSARTIPPTSDSSSRVDDSTTSLGSSSGPTSTFASTGTTASSYASALGTSGASGNTVSEENAKPKGSGATEGDFDSSAPNASFNQDIGGKNDPGRVAETTFEQGNAKSGNDAGYEGANATKLTGAQGGFETLGETSA